MNSPARHLKAVADENGELDLQKLLDRVIIAERDAKTWAFRCRELERDDQARAEASKHWPQALELFEVWKTSCRHPNSDFSADRFWLIEPFLRRKAYGFEKCLMAIRGAAFDPWTSKRKNGSLYRHDGWDKIFGSADRFEDFCCRAPRA
jgi:hypothetical protein